jgi:hypothetical protein
MNEETFNLSIRKFLKMVGVNSQRAIEQAVDRAVADGTIEGTESFPAIVTLEIEGLKLNVKFDGNIALE